MDKLREGRGQLSRAGPAKCWETDLGMATGQGGRAPDRGLARGLNVDTQRGMIMYEVLFRTSTDQSGVQEAGNMPLFFTDLLYMDVEALRETPKETNHGFYLWL
jgi:hypothetical protein